MFEFNIDKIIEHYQNDYDEIEDQIRSENPNDENFQKFKKRIDLRHIFDNIKTMNEPDFNNFIRERMNNTYKIYEQNGRIKSNKTLRKKISEKITKFYKKNETVKVTNKTIGNKPSRRNSIVKKIFDRNENAPLESRFIINKRFSYLDKIEQIDKLNRTFDKNTNRMFLRLSQSTKIFQNNVKKYILWLLRNIFFHFVLIYVVRHFVYKPNRREIRQREMIVTSLENDNLKKVYLGIFGSKNYTSDIDVSIVNYGDKVHLVSQLILYIEKTFIELYGVNSLYFDIEFYSNYMMMPVQSISGVGNMVNEKYYIDTTNFTYEDFKSVSLNACASVYRNLNYSYKTAEEQDEIYEIMFQKISQFLNSFIVYIKNQYNRTEFQPIDLDYMVSDPSFRFDVNSIVNEYISITDYKKAITLHYNYLQIAENKYFELKNQLEPINKSQMIEIYNLLCIPDIFREESYVCPSTVLFVVQYLQKEKKEMEAKLSLNPRLCESEKEKWANCNIGYYGILLGLIEQFGYIWRFAKVYEDDPAHKDKKVLKYMKRIAYGLTEMFHIEDIRIVYDFMNGEPLNNELFYGVKIPD